MSAEAHVLVFGGTGALGSAVCRLLRKMNVTTTATHLSRVEQAGTQANELKLAQTLQCDIRDESQVEETVNRAVKNSGPLQSVINCAGISALTDEYDRALDEAAFNSLSPGRVREMLEVNTLGSLNVSQAAMRHLQPKGGNIVLTGSLDCVKAVPSPVHYAMSKMAVRGLVESLARQAGKFDICVNLVAPGLSNAGGALQLNQAARDMYIKYCGLHRLAEPDEIASMMVWLALENSYLTGQCLLLDGGL